MTVRKVVKGEAGEDATAMESCRCYTRSEPVKYKVLTESTFQILLLYDLNFSSLFGNSTGRQELLASVPTSVLRANYANLTYQPSNLKKNLQK